MGYQTQIQKIEVVPQVQMRIFACIISLKLMVEMSCCKKDQFLKRDFQPYLGISLFLQLDHGKNDFSALSLFFSWAKVSSSKMNNFFTVKNIQISETGELNGSENNTTLQGLLTDGSFRTSSISYKKYTLLLPQE